MSECIFPATQLTELVLGWKAAPSAALLRRIARLSTPMFTRLAWYERVPVRRHPAVAAACRAALPGWLAAVSERRLYEGRLFSHVLHLVKLVICREAARHGWVLLSRRQWYRRQLRDEPRQLRRLMAEPAWRRGADARTVLVAVLPHLVGRVWCRGCRREVREAYPRAGITLESQLPRSGRWTSQDREEHVQVFISETGVIEGVVHERDAKSLRPRRLPLADPPPRSRTPVSTRDLACC